MAKRPRKPAAGKTAPAASSAPQETAAPPTGTVASDAAPEGELTRVLVASVSARGRRRAGQRFGAEPAELHVSDETLALLEGDPELIVKRD